MIDFLIKIDKNRALSSLPDLFSVKPVFQYSFSDERIDFAVWTDPIVPVGMDKLVQHDNSVRYLVHTIRGHYYFILLYKKTGELFIGNSLFSILPLYYSQNGNSITISSKPLLTLDKKAGNIYNKRFLLENILFNYPLFNQSCVNGVNLLPSNHYITISGGKLLCEKHTAIENYFSVQPVGGKNKAGILADLFIQSVAYYLPDEPYVNALTGGFDGRTLTACGKYHSKNFTTYSFGTAESEDVKVARQLSQKAATPFREISLDVDYVLQNSYTDGLEFISGASGTASFARAHYMHAAKLLAKEYRYMITGNFGSEIFRAAHIAGVLISPNLYRLLNAANFDEALNKLESAPEWKWLNKISFAHEWESLKEDLVTLPCFNKEYVGLTKNQQFYKIVFDEAFRKYFGAEMVNQSNHIINRTPFLDIDFVKAILATNLAGVHSDFFTNNPFKRFKGQLLYAHIIKRTYPLFGKHLLDKGYRPFDLLSLTGNARIALLYFNKKFLKQRKTIDPYAVNASFNANSDFWMKTPIDKILFDEDFVVKAFETGELRDSLFVALSQAWFYNENFRNR